MNIQDFKHAIEYAPLAASHAKDLRGFVHHDVAGDVRICADCAARITARYSAALNPSDPVWSDNPNPHAPCALCGKEV